MGARQPQNDSLSTNNAPRRRDQEESGEVMPLVGRPLPAWYRKSAQRIPRNMPATQELPMRRKFGILVHFVGERLGSERKKIRIKKDISGDRSATKGHELTFPGVVPVVNAIKSDVKPEGRESSGRRTGSKVLHALPSGSTNRSQEIDRIVKRTRFYSSQIEKGRA